LAPHDDVEEDVDDVEHDAKRDALMLFFNLKKKHLKNKFVFFYFRIGFKRVY
jgi:hypothetical protein